MAQVRLSRKTFEHLSVLPLSQTTLTPYGKGRFSPPDGVRLAPNAVVEFDLQLVDVQAVLPVDGTGNILKQVLHDGEGWESPASLFQVSEVTIIGCALSAAVSPSHQPLNAPNMR